MIIQEHDGKQRQKGQQVNADGETYNVEYEEEVHIPALFGDAIVPPQPKPQHSAHEKHTHAIDFCLDRVEPKRGTEREGERSNDRRSVDRYPIVRGMRLLSPFQDEAHSKKIEDHTGHRACKRRDEVHPHSLIGREWNHRSDSGENEK